MFENMPDVPKGKVKGAPPQPKRTPWILAVLGVLLLLLCVALVVVGGWFLAFGPGKSLVASPGLPGQSATPAPGQSPAAIAGNLAQGKIAYSVSVGDRPEDKSVWVVNADGSDAKKLLSWASSPAFSPDGTQIAYYHWNDGIYVANADGTNAHKILGEYNAKYLAWSPDGKWIAFSSQPNPGGKTNVNLDVIRPDGSGRRIAIIGGSTPSWSPDNTQFAFSTCQGGTCGIYRASTFGGTPVLIVGDSGATPDWSPDGRKIVYHADTDSIKQLFVINVDGTGKKQLTTGTVPHVDALWSPDGSYIFYRSPQGGTWGIWRMNADGSNPERIADTGVPSDWAFERLAMAQ